MREETGLTAAGERPPDRRKEGERRMQPFISIAGHEIPSYGLMVVIGSLVSFAVVLLRCRKKKVRMDDQLYFVAFILLFTLAGAKLLYQLQNLSQLWEYADTIFESWSSLFNYLGGGFVFYGGLIGGCVGAVCYAKFFRVNAVAAAENFVLVIPLFHCFGRIGCFLAGCCYGIPYDGPLAVSYTQALGAPNGVSVFPVQLLEAGLNLLVFFLLLFLDRKLSKPLQNFGVYAVVYGTERFLLEFLRGDQARGVWILSTSQWISLLIIVPVGLYMLFCRTEKNFIVWRLLNGRLPGEAFSCGNPGAGEKRRTAGNSKGADSRE